MRRKQVQRSILKKTQAPPSEVFALLFETYPNAKTELHFRNPFELIIAVILSAQCTDARVNLTTPELFAQYPTPEKMGAASLADLERLVKSCGFYRMKARAIQEASRDIATRFAGKIPRTLAELTSLRGVGRKTASVVLSQAYGVPAIAVDTHVARLSRRFGWTQSTNPEKIEQELREIVPEPYWGQINTTLVLHGRRICKARKPLCPQCPLQQICPSSTAS